MTLLSVTAIIPESCFIHCRVDKKRGDEAYKNFHIINKFRNNENKKTQLYALIFRMKKSKISADTAVFFSISSNGCRMPKI